MGSVYEAVLCGPMSFNKTVAIKTILERYSKDEEFVEMFIGEARLVADLVHPNICQVYQLGIVHRDVTPRNIMISTEGEGKLTDFGIAKAHNLMRDREGEVVMGQTPYLSPEQLRGRPTDARSDLF